jgi:hypothetical protein
MMSKHRVVGICALLLGHWTVGLPTEAQTNEKLPMPIYPIVVRISPDALESILPTYIEHSCPVNSVVLGTRAIGKNHTTGNVSVQFLTDREDAVAVIRFEGITHSRTVGTAGTVIIDSHSDTSFVCTRQLRFHPEQGFVADPTQVSATTRLVYDGFRSARGGVGSRMVSRIAQRRAAELHGEATRIIERDQRVELVSAFDERLDPKLTSLNRILSLARSVAVLWGRSPRFQLAAATSPGGLHVGLGRAENPDILIDHRMPNSDKPVEIWIHSSVLVGRFASSLSLPQLERFLLRSEQRPAWTAIRAIVQQLKSPESNRAPVSAWVRIGLGDSSTEQPLVARDTPDGHVFVSNLLAAVEQTGSKPENGKTNAVAPAQINPSVVDFQIFDLTSPLLQNYLP